ncbi:hypothetical protein ACO0SA_001698 [Hanseniaspora valbyensis]
MFIFESVHDGKKITLLMGKDKFENDLMIKYFYKEMNSVWFHVDNYSSSHVYVKLDEPIKSDINILDHISQKHLTDAMQLCKANSIAGNKLQKVEIIVTPFINLKKSGDMEPGQVSFKSTKFVKNYTCFARDNTIINRLEKTKIVLDDEPVISEDFVNEYLDISNKSEIIEKVLNAENEQKVIPNLEEFLRRCKKSKNGNYMTDFVITNKDRLILIESLRKKLKKVKKNGPSTSNKNAKKGKIIDGIDYGDFSYED